MSTKNYDLLDYGFVEATAFEGLMPKIADKIGTVGASEISVHMHGFMAKGADALEVVDFEKVYESEENNTGDETENGEENGTENGEENGTENGEENGTENSENQPE
jgi:hypothetical protein